jgi:hypothetical protein
MTMDMAHGTLAGSLRGAAMVLVVLAAGLAGWAALIGVVLRWAGQLAS